jgi:tRNA (adenine57-N1/adenine58-N1)-methyltransferase
MELRSAHAKWEDLVQLIGSGGKQFIFRLKPGDELQTHQGVIPHDQIESLGWGSTVESHLGYQFKLFQPTLRDILLNTKRQSQIIFPKDIGYILLRLSVGPGTTVVEAGTGSGALTSALAWSVGPTGHVYSYDRRSDMQNLARKNLERIGLAERVTFHNSDIEEGIREQDVPALFLDLPTPQLYLKQVFASLQSGGVMGAILPTTNQVASLLAAMQRHKMALVEVCELLIRFYKPVAERLRPADRMVAHTGYLVFGRTTVGETR